MNNNQLQIIDKREVLGKQLRIYGDFENPLFLAKDVAEWIDYDKDKVGQMLNTVDDEEKITLPIHYSGQVRNMWFLTEDGLYEVLMQSRKPIAKKFKKKVKEILKSVRKKGIYATDNVIDNILENPEFGIKLLTEIKEERAKNKELEDKIEKDKPKVLFAEAVSIAKNTILIREMAKLIKQNGIDMGERRLFIWLRENGYLIKKVGTDYNMPTQKSMNLGLFEIKETPVLHSSREIEIIRHQRLQVKDNNIS